MKLLKYCPQKASPNSRRDSLRKQLFLLALRRKRMFSQARGGTMHVKYETIKNWLRPLTKEQQTQRKDYLDMLDLVPRFLTSYIETENYFVTEHIYLYRTKDIDTHHSVRRSEDNTHVIGSQSSQSEKLNFLTWPIIHVVMISFTVFTWRPRELSLDIQIFRHP